jgi:hypothetical protein
MYDAFVAFVGLNWLNWFCSPPMLRPACDHEPTNAVLILAWGPRVERSRFLDVGLCGSIDLDLDLEH